MVRRAVDGVIELHRLLVKRGYTAHIMSHRGLIEGNEKPRPNIGAAGHASMSSHQHRFRQ